MASLYDFIYRDTNRLNSYYAQLFSGRLISREKSDTNTETQEKGGGISTYVAKGDLKNSKQSQSSAKELIDPHDLATTDTLAELLNSGLASKDVQNAAQGSLVLAEGTVTFIDKYLLELTDAGLEIAIQQEKAKGRDQNKVVVQQYEATRKILPKLILPSAFLFVAKNGLQLVGTIKDNGLEEPISGYYFKHGINGIADIYCLGIKEISTPLIGLSQSPLIIASQLIIEKLSNLLFSANAIRITPVAMFRNLNKQ